MSDTLRIPSAPPPEFLARGRVMSREAIASGDNQLIYSAVPVRRGGGKGFERFFAGVCGSENFPEFFARRGVQRQEVGVDGTIGAPASLDWDVALQNL